MFEWLATDGETNTNLIERVNLEDREEDRVLLRCILGKFVIRIKCG